MERIKKMAGVKRLFPAGLPEREWVTFTARGFTRPVTGVIYRTAHPACCGVPMGGIGTGCLDIETTGVLGFSTVLDQTSRYSIPAVGPQQTPQEPNYRNRRPQLLLPFLGLAVGDKTWVLTTRRFIEGGTIEGCTEPKLVSRDLRDTPSEAPWFHGVWQVDVPSVDGVEAAREIDYWGHYPIADMEFDTSAPVEVGLRAWAPFIPGYLAASSVPGAVFEVRLSNSTGAIQSGTLAFSFPGPEHTASERREYRRDVVKEELFQCLAVSSTGEKTGYVLGVITRQAQGLKDMVLVEGTGTPAKVRFGAGLHQKPSAWSRLALELPLQSTSNGGATRVCDDGSASVAVDFVLQPGETGMVRILLAWYAPEWIGAGWKSLLPFEPPSWKDEMGDYQIPGRDGEGWEGEYYTAMYATRFRSAVEVARYLVWNHDSLLGRVLAWQEAVYTADKLPPWLQDSLINHLSLITETSFWAQPKLPLGDWSFPGGTFGLMESPRGCPITGCIFSNWYGDWPLLYFFPELERMILRNYREYIRPDGAVPFLFAYADFTKPTYEWIMPLNGVCYADMVDRLWRRTGDDDILREFYPSVKKSTNFTMTLTPGPEGIVSARPTPDGKPRPGQLPWEHTVVQGMVTLIAGLRLFNLQVAKRMAESMGDQEFAGRCQSWFEHARALMDEKLWAGDSYLLYYAPKTGERNEGLEGEHCAAMYATLFRSAVENDDILSAQLDGDWASMCHGFPGVFRGDRAKTTLETIKQTCVIDYGFVGFASRQEGVKLTGYGTFYPENIIAAMTYMYHGQKEFGLQILHRFVHNVVCKQRHPWDTPNLIYGDTGERSFGTDYFQNMLLWAVPAAMEGKELSEPCRPHGLVDRIIRAGRKGKVTINWAKVVETEGQEEIKKFVER